MKLQSLQDGQYVRLIVWIDAEFPQVSVSGIVEHITHRTMVQDEKGRGLLVEWHNTGTQKFLPGPTNSYWVNEEEGVKVFQITADV